jgi:hypothetical protein
MVEMCDMKEVPQLSIPEEQMENSPMCGKQMLGADLMEVDEERLVIEEYQKAGAAFEFRERQAYYAGELAALGEKRFWRRLCELAVDGSGRTSVAGEELFEMTDSSTEVIMALTFAGVGFQRAGVQYEAADRNGLLLSSSAPFIGVLLTTAVDENSEATSAELIISQKIYDPKR